MILEIKNDEIKVENYRDDDFLLESFECAIASNAFLFVFQVH